MARFGRGAPFPRWTRPHIPDPPAATTANADIAVGRGQAFGLGDSGSIPIGRGTAFDPTVLVSGVVRPPTALGTGLAPGVSPQVVQPAGVATGVGTAPTARAISDSMLWVSGESVDWVSGESVDWD